MQRESAARAFAIQQRGCGDRHKRPQIAEAREGQVVPEDAVAAARDQERHDGAGVVLPQVEIVALDVDRAELLLA